MLIKNLITILSAKEENIEEKKINKEVKSIGYHIDDVVNNVDDGLVFFAYKGNNFDSTDKAIELYLAKKISVIVTDRTLPKNISHIVVDDVRTALTLASIAFFENKLDRLKKVAITGTNGKTTTSILIGAILSYAKNKIVTIGTNGIFIDKEVFDNNTTTPSGYDFVKYASLGVDAGCSYLVSEVSSHALDQNRLKGVSFDVAVFTNLTGDHLDYHKDMDNYFDAKSKLFEDNYSDIKVINITSKYGEKLLAKLDRSKCVTYAVGKEADVYCIDYKISIDGLDATIFIHGVEYNIKSKLIGEYNLENILASIAAAKSLSIDDEIIIKGIETLEAIDGRLQRVQAKDFTVFVDYAHTDDALENVLNTIGSIATRRIITVFGCGGDRDKSKRTRMAKVAERLSSVVIVTSDNPRSEEPMNIIEDMLSESTDRSSFIIEVNRTSAIKKAILLADKGDIILIAGKGHEKYQIIKGEKMIFDDTEEALMYLKEFNK